MMNIKRTAEDAAAGEDPDELYLAENVFWVPKEARRSHLQANAKQPSIGKLIDEAMAAKDKHVCGFRLYVERENRRAQKTYRALGMDRTRYLVFEELKPGVRFYR